MHNCLDEYLRARGFHANPFATTNAEQEKDRLPSFFVRVPWFDWIVGDPRHPESLILFAPQGHGKTSHRVEVARHAGERREYPALVVTFTDFDLLLHAGLEQVTIGNYLSIIRRLTLKSLADQLNHAPGRLALLQQHAMLPRLHVLLQLYAPLQTLDVVVSASTTSTLLQAFQQTQLGIKEWLHELSQLVHSAGFASVYFLLDGMDETYETRDNPAAMLRLLSPLLDAPGILQECGFAFKFFLPHMLEAHMQQEQIGRIDRIPYRSLSWSNEQLLNMLSQRLTSYSRISETSPMGYVNCFQDLCDVDFDVDLLLVQSANSSPRRLIDLARQIVEHHCQSNADPDALIDVETITTVLARAADPTPATLDTAATLHTDAPVPAADKPALLFVDTRGDIWLGNQRLATDLPRLLRTCMDFLWYNRHRNISYAELQQALYGADLEDRGDPRNSCDKIIRRLRDKLEPGHPGSRTYIDVQSGYGYVLRNFREEPG